MMNDSTMSIPNKGARQDSKRDSSSRKSSLSSSARRPGSRLKQSSLSSRTHSRASSLSGTPRHRPLQLLPSMPLSTAYQLEQQSFETSLELKKLRHRCGQLQTALRQTQGQLREERRKAQELNGYAVKLKKKVQYYKRVMREHKMREEGEVSSSSEKEGDDGEEI